MLAIHIVVWMLSVGLAATVCAQEYPSKPVHLLIGNAAGGSADTVSRVVAPKLSQNLGQPVVVENRPGAATAIATERVAKSPPDGYTLLMLTSTAFTLPALRPNLPYVLERDFAPISLVATGTTFLVVHPSLPVRNVKELIALAQSMPGKLNYGSSGVGSASHLAGELFNLLAKVKLVHVPYKGAAEATIANVSGQVEINFPSTTSVLPILEAGKVKALAVTSAKRSVLLPSIPALDELGLRGFDYTSVFGVIAPAAVPKNVIARLNAAIGATVGTAEMKESILKQGLEPQIGSPEQFAALIRLHLKNMAMVVKSAGLKDE